MATEHVFIQQIDRIQSHFDSLVEAGSDQELFISGYLNGHFSLVTSQCINEQLLEIDDLDRKMQESLSVAFNNEELQTEDQHQVFVFWERCLALVS